MAKFASNGMLDGTLDKIALSTKLTVCSAQPTVFADIATNKLADVTISSGAFSKAAGSPSGRKVTIAAQNNITITASGTATHVVVDDGTNFYATTCTSQALLINNTVSVPAWSVTIPQAT